MATRQVAEAGEEMMAQSPVENERHAPEGKPPRAYEQQAHNPVTAVS